MSPKASRSRCAVPGASGSWSWRHRAGAIGDWYRIPRSSSSGQPVDGLRGRRRDRDLDQPIDQPPEPGQAVPPRAAQAERLAEQLVVLVAQVVQQHRVVGRHQARVVHGTGEPGGLGLQGRAVHRRQAVAVDLHPGILAAAAGGAVQAADEPVGAVSARTEVDAGVAPVHGDLGDHLGHDVDHDRPLAEDAPDLVDQLGQDAFVPEGLGDVLDGAAGDAREAGGLFPFGLAGPAEQQRHVQRQHLGEVVGRVLGRDRRVGAFAPGHGQQPQQAQGLDQHGVGVGAPERPGAEGGVEQLGLLPVGAGEHAGVVHRAGAFTDGGGPTGLEQDASCRVQHGADVRHLRESRRLGQLGGRVVEAFDQPVEIAGRRGSLVGPLHGRSLPAADERGHARRGRPDVVATRRSPDPPGP